MKKSLYPFILIIIFISLIIPLNNIFAISDALFNVDVNTVALWRFNESVLNPIIDEVGVNNGTAVGTAIQAGKFGSARYFGGYGNYIVVPDNASLRNLSQITIESWAYPTGFDLGCWANNESFVQKGKGDESNAYSLKIWRNQEGWCASANSFNQLNFNVNFGGAAISTRWFEPNQWYYVVFTYDGSYLKIYVNGTLEAVSIYTPNLTVTTSDPLYINRHTWAGGYQSSQGRMQGLIDEIRISNIARSAEEVAYYYNLVSRPSQFWSQIKNTPTGFLNLRQNAGIPNVLLKTLPNGWAVKILKTADENGNNIDIDGYHWYQVYDASDGTTGWMAAKNLSDNATYLDYDVSNQSELQNKTEIQSDTMDKRKQIILDAVNNYYTKDNAENSLYSGGGGRDNKNNFQKFIIGSEFPKELVLAVAAEESGGHEFNNEACADAFDGGIGIMQITSPDSKGLGSGLDIDSKRNNCKGEEWVGRFSKYYSNALQGIYANIKDGFRVLQDKHDQTLRLMANPRIIAPCPLTIDGVDLTCSDIQKSLTVWGYNGISKNKKGMYGDYLGDVAIKLRNLNNYFAGIINDINKIAVETLSRKLETVNNNKTLVKLNSPGELQIIDSQGRKTGVFDNIIKEEIPFSVYDANVKGAAIFFQNDSYIYNIVGTASGTYGLDIENAQHGEFSGFSAVNLPITEDEIYQYQIDWDALNRNEKGVKVKIDKNGDGIFDYQFQSLQLLQDSIAPITTISLSGTQGLNNWHISDVQINLLANDNETGVGVLKTEYSFDNGATWNTYLNPFILSNEGINHILYRSQDFLSNLEQTKLLEIKIDKTAPEAVIYFDKDNQKLKIEGTDNLTADPAVFVIENNKKENVVYQIEDEAGNTTKLFFEKFKQEGKQIKAELKSIQYNNGEIINLSEAGLKYEWSANKDGIIKELEQNIKIKDKFEVWAKYNHQRNETEIKIKKENEKEIKQILPGLAIIKLIIKSGELSFEF